MRLVRRLFLKSMIVTMPRVSAWNYDVTESGTVKEVGMKRIVDQKVLPSLLTSQQPM